MGTDDKVQLVWGPKCLRQRRCTTNSTPTPPDLPTPPLRPVERSVPRPGQAVTEPPLCSSSSRPCPSSARQEVGGAGTVPPEEARRKPDAQASRDPGRTREP